MGKSLDSESAPIGIRRATLRDLDTLVEHRRRMWNDIWHFTPEQFLRADRAYRKWVVTMMRRRRYVGFLAVTREGRIVASGCVWIKSEGHPSPWSPSPRKPDLMSMYTDPSFRRRGLATRIAKEAMKWCTRNGFTSLTLHATDMGEDLYAKLGFQKTGEMRMNLGRHNRLTPAQLL